MEMKVHVFPLQLLDNNQAIIIKASILKCISQTSLKAVSAY